MSRGEWMTEERWAPIREHARRVAMGLPPLTEEEKAAIRLLLRDDTPRRNR